MKTQSVETGVDVRTGARATSIGHPLWQLLLHAAEGLQAVRQGQSVRASVAAWPLGVRAGAQAILFHTLRHLGVAEALRVQLAPRKPSARVDGLLCTALALLWHPQEGASYDAFTVVNQAVQAARQHPNTRSQAGFINACLRRFLRERQAFEAVCLQQPQARWNYPGWWIEKLKAQYPAHWQSILDAGNARAPMTLRVNSSQISVTDFVRALQNTGVQAAPVLQNGLLLVEAVDVRQLPGYAQGWFSVQDAGAQLAAPWLLDGLEPQAGAALRVLDACAAPGGKTAHLLELAHSSGKKMQLLALDVDASRCERIHENLERLRLETDVLAADAAQLSQWQAWLQGQLLDGILLDVPCTASGIVRRHPDVRWLRRETDVAQLAAVQQKLLHRLWPLLREGGRLLYCTCSVFHEEGVQQMQAFVQAHADAQVVMQPLHLLPQGTSADVAAWTLPAQAGDNAVEADLPLPPDHDGFFYCLLEKRAKPAPG